MQLKTNIKPYVMEATTKPELEFKVKNNWRAMSYRCSKVGSSLASYDKRILVNYQKFRSKRGVRKAHWKAYVYIIPEELLKTMGLTAVQNKRNFDIRPVKKY